MTSNSFRDFLVTFISIIFEAMPFIVIGALVSGALEELLPQKFFSRWLPKNRFLAIVLSSFMGFLLPMCECGIVPVMRRLLNKGVPASCAVTYMLSAPILNPIVLISTALAFSGSVDLFGVGDGLGMVLMRGGGAFLTAVSVGLIFERLDRMGVPLTQGNITRARLVGSAESDRLLAEEGALNVLPHAETCSDCGHDHAHGHEHHHDHDHHDHDHGHSHDHAHHDHAPAPRSLLDRLTAISEIALGDFLDIAAFLVIGAALAATVNTALPRQNLDEIAQYETASVVAMMALAYVLSLCSEADAFVAANFTAIALGAKLAFLVLGPMLDIKLTIMYQWVFTRRAVWTIVGALLSIVFLLGLIANQLPTEGPRAFFSAAAS